MLQLAEDGHSACPVENLERHMLQLPQVECPVEHHFGPGVYMRQVTIPAGTLAAGHCHKYDHLNILLSGAIALLDDAGQVQVLRAPVIFQGKPGRKVAYVIDTVTWLNLFATAETDVDVLDAMLVDKSATWQDFHKDADRLAQAMARQLTPQET